MAEIYPSDAELNALLSDSETGVEYIPTGTAPYYVHFRRLLYRLLLATKRANDFRLYPEGGLNFGVKAGKFWLGNLRCDYPGSSGNVARDNRTDFIYITSDLTVQIDGMGWEYWTSLSNEMVCVAEITSLNGEITNIVDCRDAHSMAMPTIPKKRTIHHTEWVQLDHGDSGSLHTNKGCVGDLYLPLPLYDLDGSYFHFFNHTGNELHVYPTGNKMFLDGTVTAINKGIRSNAKGDSCTVVKQEDGEWLVSAVHGNWVQDT